MAAPGQCAECRAIARELTDAYVDLVHQDLRNPLEDTRALEDRLAAWRAWMKDPEVQGQTIPTIAPEILDLKRWRQPPPAVHPLAQVFFKKIAHESRTGHRVKFPPSI